MDKRPQPLLDDACTAFVRGLTAKTIDGRARWDKHPNGLISYLPGSVFVQFIIHASDRGQDWHLFQVRDSNGELFRATPPASRIENPTLVLAVEALFMTVIGAGPPLIQ